MDRAKNLARQSVIKNDCPNQACSCYIGLGGWVTGHLSPDSITLTIIIEAKLNIHFLFLHSNVFLRALLYHIKILLVEKEEEIEPRATQSLGNHSNHTA